jgi:uncharacterized protein (DUF433 family)
LKSLGFRQPSIHRVPVIIGVSRRSKDGLIHKLKQIAMTAIISEHIQITPGVCGGKPRIAGHRIRVQDIVIWYEHLNMSPDEIIYHYPSITLADVHAALAYYYDHLEEIRQQIRESEAFVAQMAAETPSILQRTLKKRNVRSD